MRNKQLTIASSANNPKPKQTSKEEPTTYKTRGIKKWLEILAKKKRVEENGFEPNFVFLGNLNATKENS